MRDFRKLEVWKQAKRLAVSCYQQTASFPRVEAYGLTSQIRRSAVSIPANVAEGVGRDSDRELLRFLRIALGSLNELESLVVIASELGFLSQTSEQVLEDEMKDLGVRLRNLVKRVEATVEGRLEVREEIGAYA